MEFRQLIQDIKSRAAQYFFNYSTQMVLWFGTDIDAKDNNGQTFLHKATQLNNKETIEMLIESGANIEAKNSHGYTALIIASHNNNVEITKLLIEKGADIEVEDNNGYTALLWAIYNNHIEIAKLLIKKGADVKVKDNTGDTPLLWAIYYNHVEIIKLLLEKGANTNDEDVKDEILHLMLKNEDVDLIKLLLDKIKFDNDDMSYFVYKSQNTQIEELLAKHGYNIDNINLQQVLKIALAYKDTSTVEQLFNEQVELNYTLVGFSNIRGEWSDNISNIAKHMMAHEDNLYVLPINQSHVNNEKFISMFSGFINPGAGDNFPRDKEFRLTDLSKDTMLAKEHLYQAILEVSNKYHIPYIGICSGSQHLILNNEGYLNSVEGYTQSGHSVKFIPGSFSYFMTLFNDEKARVLEKCIMPEVEFKIYTAHSFAGQKDKLGKVKLGAVSEEGVVQSTYLGMNKIGFQFHPENYYFSDMQENRQKAIWDNFFELVADHYRAVKFAKDNHIAPEILYKRLQEAEELILNRLAECVEKALSPNLKKNHFVYKESCISEPQYRKNMKNIIEKNIMPIEDHLSLIGNIEV